MIRPAGLLASALGTTTFGILLFSIAAIFASNRSGRAFWIAFAVVGWGILLVPLYFDHGPQSPTFALVATVADFLMPYQQGDVDGDKFGPTFYAMHSMLGLASGYVAGCLNRTLYRRRESESKVGD
jgi:hypothetical protein